MTDITMCQIIHRCKYVAIGLHRASRIYLGRIEYTVNAMKELNLESMGTFEKIVQCLQDEWLGKSILKENLGSDSRSYRRT